MASGICWFWCLALAFSVSSSIEPCGRTNSRLFPHRERRTGAGVRRAAEHSSGAEFGLVQRHALGIAAHDGVESDHRLESDTEARLHEFKLILRVCRLLRFQKVDQRPLLRKRLAARGGHEDRKLVRVFIERIAVRILHQLQLRNTYLCVGIQLAAVHDALAPQHRLIRKPSGADEQPAPQLEVLEDQWRRLPEAGLLLHWHAVARRTTTPLSRGVVGTAA